jgi:hypothetical protein
VGIVSLKDARATAKRILAERTLGEQTSPSVSFEEAIKLFISTHYGDYHPPRTKEETERLHNKHFHVCWTYPFRCAGCLPLKYSESRLIRQECVSVTECAIGDEADPLLHGKGRQVKLPSQDDLRFH